MPSVVIDEGYKITASSDAHVLCPPPYIRMEQIEPVQAPNGTNRAGSCSDMVLWGMEVGVASLTGRLRKLGRFGH